MTTKQKILKCLAIVWDRWCGLRVRKGSSNPLLSRRLTKVAFVGALTANTLLLVMYLGVSDRTPLGEFVTIWPPFLWCLLLIPFTLLSWNREAKRYFILSCGATIAFLLLTVEWLPLLRRGESKGSREFEKLRSAPEANGPLGLRIMTWNINGGAGGMEKLLAMVESYAPDLCLFQETPDDPANVHPMPSHKLFGAYTWIDDGDCGLLSRYPVRVLPSVKVGPWTPMQAGMIELPRGRQLLVCNARLMLPSLVLNPLSADRRRELRADHRARLAQFVNAANWFKRIRTLYGGVPCIFAGDFNTPGGMYSLSPLDRIPLIDCWKKSGRGWGGTMTAQAPMARIDQCWVSPEVDVVRAGVCLGEPSDHRGLLVDLVIK